MSKPNYVYPDSLPKVTGMLVFEVVGSNPNGDPAADGTPREMDGHGIISHVSTKARIKELLVRGHPVWEDTIQALKLNPDEFQVILRKGNEIKFVNETISKWKQEGFVKDWPSRINGASIFDSRKEEVDDSDDKSSGTKKKATDSKPKRENHAQTGIFVVGQGMSLNRIKIDTHSLTRAVAVSADDNGKDKGGAMGAYSVVRYGIYCQPFFINPNPKLVENSHVRPVDIEVLRRLLPYIGEVRSATRSQVNVRQVLWFEHQNKIGDIADWKLLEAMKPLLKGDGDRVEDYEFFNAQSQRIKEILGDKASRVYDFAV